MRGSGYVYREDAYDAGSLEDWYINSVDDTVPPCFTPEVLGVVAAFFYLLPVWSGLRIEKKPVNGCLALSESLSEKRFYEMCRQYLQRSGISCNGRKWTHRHSEEICNDFYVISKFSGKR